MGITALTDQSVVPYKWRRRRCYRPLGVRLGFLRRHHVESAIAIEASPERAPLPVCLWQENPNRLVNLWDMLQNYSPIYQIALELEKLRDIATAWKASSMELYDLHKGDFSKLLTNIQRECFDHGLIYTAEMAERGIKKPPPERYADMLSALNHLDESLNSELKKESVVRIPPDRKGYFEHVELFGANVAAAFPSCARDIQKSGDCYSLEQADACVHHLMLVLERGLNALAGKVGVSYQRTNWQEIINNIALQVKSMPRGKEKEFYLTVNAQFGFLKDAYRNHAEHARDEHYDVPKALSILNHVREFMQALAEGGLAE